MLILGFQERETWLSPHPKKGDPGYPHPKKKGDQEKNLQTFMLQDVMMKCGISRKDTKIVLKVLQVVLTFYWNFNIQTL